MVRNVKRILEKHPVTRHLKPAQADQWGSDRFTVQRDQEFRDPSMLAKGITSNLTGTRADVIICDDVEVPKTCDTAEKRAFLRERLGELDYILSSGGTQIYIGTPHAFHTIYGDVPRRNLGEDKIFLDGFSRLVVPVLDKSGQSVWPERFPLEKINAIRRRTGPAQFQSQMLCKPVNISSGYLRPEQLRHYEAEIDYREANGRAVLSIGGRRMVSVSAWWDPSFGREGGDRSVVAIVYCDEAGEYWLHHLAHLRISKGSEEDEATQQCKQVAELVKRFYLPSVALETNGIGKFLPGILRREMGAAQLSCAVREMVSRHSKSARILESFDAVLAARALHVHAAVMETPFVREMEDWRPGGNSGHDDCLDAVAGAIALEPVRVRRVFTGAHRPEWRG